MRNFYLVKCECGEEILFFQISRPWIKPWKAISPSMLRANRIKLKPAEEAEQIRELLAERVFRMVAEIDSKR
jgi:hypothetical protein